MYDVITVGNAARDVIIKSREFKIRRDPHSTTGFSETFALGTKVIIDEVYTGVGGGGVNAAVTFARQDLKVAYLGKVGKDSAGKEISHFLDEEGISPQFLEQSEKFSTPFSTILLASGGERTALVYRGNGEKLRRKDIPFEKLKAQWFYITSLGGDLEILKALCNQAKKIDARIALNPGIEELKQKKFTNLLADIDVLLMNNEEASLLVSESKRHDQGLLKTLAAEIKGLVVITNGARGAAVCDQETITYIAAQKIKVVDRLGAGDAFGSGFVAGIIRFPGNLDKALQVAITNATSVCSKHGATAGIITRQHKLVKPKMTKHAIET